MPKIELQTVASVEPIVGPRLGALPLPADPTTNQISVICLSVSPSKIKIIETVTEVAPERIVRIDAFHSKIQFGQPRKLRKVKPGVPGGAVGVRDGRNLVVREAIPVEGNPLAQSRNAIAEIHRRLPISWLVWAPTC